MKLFKIQYLFLLVGCLTLFSCSKDDDIKKETIPDYLKAIILAKNEYTLEKEACHLDFDIQANVTFEVKVEGDWIKQVQSRGLESHSLYFDVAENTGDDEREGKIVISSGNIEQVIKVIQRGKTVDVEKIAEYVVEVSEKVDPLFMECETIEELATHLDEIKNVDGVADAWVTNTALFVELEGGFPLFWYYTPNEEMIETKTMGNASNLAKSRNVTWNEHEYMDSFSKVCIINQQANDESMDFLKSEYATLAMDFKIAGFEVDVFEGEKVNVSFLENNLTFYDIVFLITHGIYDERKKNHWIASGEEVRNVKEMIDKLQKKGLEGWGIGMVEETRSGMPRLIRYVNFSEPFFTNSMSGTFDKSIIFNVACQSLKENISLAEAFFSKGAAVYLGYDESNCIGQEAGKFFYEQMLQGMTAEDAKNSLPDSYRINEFKYKGVKIKANLVGVARNSTMENVCIVHPKPETFDADGVNVNNATLYGRINGWKKTLKSEIGFCYSANDNEPTIERECEFKSLVYEPMTGDPEFQIEIGNLEPNVTYYYRAYICVNGQYIYGEVKSFTTHNPVTTLDATNVGSTFATLNANLESWMNLFIHFGFCYSKDGENLDVNNGIRHGEIVAFNFDSKLYSVVLDALEPGTTYYYRAFTEIYNGQYEYVYGDVKSFTTTTEEQTCVAEAVDLGLSVLWASYNVGATKPEEYGGYYAWGETEEKEKYTVSNYKFYNMMTGGMTDLGKKISETKYDVAKIKWGDGWRMPTANEMLELTEQCEWTDTVCGTVKGKKITGKNGNSIFLPAVGAGTPASEVLIPNKVGSYWTGELDESCLGGVNLFFEYDWTVLVDVKAGASRWYGLPVRPVKDK